MNYPKRAAAPHAVFVTDEKIIPSFYGFVNSILLDTDGVTDYNNIKK